jgi:regulator of protease activity HflC (stomatin/prohibitin superfamily)
MLALKYLLMILGVGLFGSAAALVAYDIYLSEQLRRLLSRNKTDESGAEVGALARCPFRPVRWRLALQLMAAGALTLLFTESLVVIPDGAAGVRVSEIWGARPGTLYPGIHLVTPLVDSIAIYDTREQVYSTVAGENSKQKGDVLTVQAREGLNIGLAVSVRYRLDPRRLDSIQTNLPQPVGEQVVAPVVSTVYRQFAPNYVTREIFATKREELRTKAAEAIAARLASDGIIVREVLLRDLQLPGEYAKGLEGLPLKEQENERLGTEQEIKQKEVKIAELEAKAQKSRDVKGAEAQGASARAASQSGSGCHAIHAAAETEADRAEQARSRSTQGINVAKRRSCGAGEGYRQQSRGGTAEESCRCRSKPHPGDGCGGCGAYEVRGVRAEVESHADSENHRGAALRQVANHDGADRREEFLCE